MPKTPNFTRSVLIDDLPGKDGRGVVSLTAADGVTPQGEGEGPVVLVAVRGKDGRTRAHYDHLSNAGYDVRAEYERQMRMSTIERMRVARVVQMRRVAEALCALDLDASIRLGAFANRIADTPRGTTGPPSQPDIESVVTYLMAGHESLATAILAAFDGSKDIERTRMVGADEIVDALRDAGLLRVPA